MNDDLIVEALPKTYGDWLTTVVLDCESRGMSHVVIELDEAKNIADVLLKIANSATTKTTPSYEYVFHCISCGTEIDKEELRDGHQCEKCKTEEWMERRKFSQLSSSRREQGRELSPAELSRCESALSAKYSKFSHLDKDK
jgi:predicted Zn-ribbon and HTH transcriptional regulator